MASRWMVPESDSMIFVMDMVVVTDVGLDLKLTSLDKVLGLNSI